VFVAGSEFLGSRSARMSAARQRLSATRARNAPAPEPVRKRVTTPMLLAILCLIIGFATGYSAASILPLVHFHTETYAR
jgi:hypothetical protein